MSITSIQDLFEKQKILGPVSFNDKTNLCATFLQVQTATRSEKRFPKSDVARATHFPFLGYSLQDCHQNGTLDLLFHIKKALQLKCARYFIYPLRFVYSERHTLR